MAEAQYFTAVKTGDLTVIHFKPNSILTGEKALSIADDLVELIERHGCRQLVINFANVAMLTSLMIGKLFALNQKMQAVRGRLALCEMQSDIREILDLVKVTSVISTFATEADATKSLLLTPP